MSIAIKQVVLTGDRPTGPLHLGHYAGSLINRVKLQNELDTEGQQKYRVYVMAADMQALTDNFSTPEKVVNNVYEIVADYLAVGIDPEKSIIFIQSQIPELAELLPYYMNMVNLGRLQRNPTVKTEIQQKGYEKSVPVGFLCYPISQAIDITIVKADLVPVGDDQLPLIEQTNEIVRNFNRIYNTNCLKEAKALLGSTPRLVGIDGNAKASKSLGNAIFLSDSPEEIKRKIFSMYTDPDHLKISDSGKIEGNVVFSYLDAFHENKEEIEGLKAHYKRGGLGDIQIKSLLNETIQKILEPIRMRRLEISYQQKYIREILEYGTESMRKVAKQTVQEIKNAMGLIYK